MYLLQILLERIAENPFVLAAVVFIIILIGSMCIGY